jgi:hypothetical protein
MSLSEAQIRQLEKRARGFRRLIAALNDLNMYGIHEQIDKMLFVKIEDLKEHLKKKIKRNNEKLNEIYTETVDALVDDDYQSGEIGYKPTEVHKEEPVGESFTSKDYSKRTYKSIKEHGTDISFENE